MALTEYRRKRKFSRTPEPTGGKPSRDALRFVVQKHQASRLHYDFRLELDGVLVSWAVPKGPSLNPADKRLAMKVEDHPLDYRTFEGVIPKGNYGAGTVMVWDEGTYSDYEDSDTFEEARKHLKAGLMKGDLKFRLHGQKLNGAYALVKIKNEDNSWLLIKKQDEYARDDDAAGDDFSAITGKSMEDIARGTRQWLPKPKLNTRGGKKAPMPDSASPMLATLADKPVDDPGWIYEIKWDGYRIQARVEGGRAELLSRGSKDYTSIFSPICRELSDLKIDCILDGEVVVVDKDGKSDFAALQNYQKTGEGNLVYYVFDALYADGYDLRPQPLTRRKENAAQIIAPLKNVRLSDHVVGRGAKFFAAAQAGGLEGIIAKEANSTYTGRRSRSWLKIKTQQRQEAVIGGWTEPKGSRKDIGALVLGVYDDDGKLRYIGHTGGGMNDRLLGDLRKRLAAMERKTSPFADTFKVNAPVHWVSPKLMAEVTFSEWTDDGRMRQPIFAGLREDKDPTTVRRERPVDAEDIVEQPASGQKAEITHRDKVFWPKESITKGDLIDYYESMADAILPYLAGRPESLNRYPNGIEGKNFFQKDLEHHPEWVKPAPIYSESNGKDLNWLVINDRDTLLYAVNLGSIELNPWHSRIEALEQPDYCLIDLDAKTCGFETVVTVAQEARKILDKLGVQSVPKTSGKTGLHICIPLDARYTYEQSRMFAQVLVNVVHKRLPKLTSVERNPRKREKKIYLDYLQNRTGQTMAAPYCVRPVPGATVSAPLKWSEVKKGLDPKKYTMKTMGKRLEKAGDLWAPVLGEGVNIKKVLAELE